MTWIEDYRTKIGMSRMQFARAVTRELGGSGERRLWVSESLIYILETWSKAVTHPKIINMIAHACGATKAQRDQFLAKDRRGYPFKHSPARVRLDMPKREAAKPVKPERSHRRDHNRRAVVIIDRAGNEVKRCESLLDAGEEIGLTASSIRVRCAHKLPSEFGAGQIYSCRYADEWDAMTPTARAADIRRARERGGETKAVPRRDYCKKAVVVLDKTGRELARYASIGEASRGEIINDDCIRNRCYRRVLQEFTSTNDSTYRFADEWDAMTPEQRERDLSAAM